MQKKWLAALLVLAMIIMALPAAAANESPENNENKNVNRKCPRGNHRQFPSYGNR